MIRETDIDVVVTVVMLGRINCNGAGETCCNGVWGGGETYRFFFLLFFKLVFYIVQILLYNMMLDFFILLSVSVI